MDVSYIEIEKFMLGKKIIAVDTYMSYVYITFDDGSEIDIYLVMDYTSGKLKMDMRYPEEN